MPSETENNLVIALCDMGREFRGGQRQTLNLARTLEYNGLEVMVVCRTGGELLKRCENNGIEVVPARYNALTLYPEGKRIAKELSERRADIFNACDSHAHSLGLSVKRSYRQIRLVVTSRTVFNKSGILSHKLKYASGDIDRFIAISDAVRTVLIKKEVKASRIEVIPSSVDSDLFSPHGREESGVFRIGTACALEEGKGVSFILKALAQIKDNSTDFIFFIAGKGPQRDDLEQQVKNLGLTGRVEFFGFVEDMPDFYRDLDLFVLASKSEGLGSSLLEAGACGAVIAGSDLPAIHEIIDNGQDGFIFDTNEPQSLAGIITRLMENCDLCKRMRMEFYNKLTKYDINHITEKYIGIYRVLANRD